MTREFDDSAMAKSIYGTEVRVLAGEVGVDPETLDLEALYFTGVLLCERAITDSITLENAADSINLEAGAEMEFGRQLSEAERFFVEAMLRDVVARRQRFARY